MSRSEYQLSGTKGAELTGSPQMVGRINAGTPESGSRPLLGSADPPGMVPGIGADTGSAMTGIPGDSPAGTAKEGRKKVVVQRPQGDLAVEIVGDRNEATSTEARETTVVTAHSLAGEDDKPAPKRLTRRQEKQIARRTDGSIDDFLALRDVIADTGPQTVRRLRENPYAPDAEQIFRERFPDREYTADARRAIVVADAELDTPQTSQTEERIIITNRADEVRARKEKFLQEIDATADVVMRLLDFTTEGAAADSQWWEQPDADKYEQLTQTAFETDDQDAIDQKYTKSHQKDVRLGIVNMIEDYRILEDYRGKFTDPQTQRETVENALSQFLEDRHLTDGMRVESYPLGFVVYLTEDDFRKVRPEQAGFVIPDAGDSALHHRIAVMRLAKNGKAYPEDNLKEKVRHEKRHVIFGNYFAEYTDDIAYPDEITAGPENAQLAKSIRSKTEEHTKNELIAYAEHMPDKWIDASSLGVDDYSFKLKAAYYVIWKQKDISPEQRAELFAPYIDNFSIYLDQISEFQWIARKLYEKSVHADPTSADALTKEKVRALLHITPVREARRLGVYLGMDPAHLQEEFVTLYRQEKEQAIEKFTATVAGLMEVAKKGDLTGEDLKEAWFDGLSGSQLYQIQFTYAKEALPTLLDIIKGSPEERHIKGSIQALEMMVFKHLGDLSEQELQTINESLKTVFSTRYGKEYDSVKDQALDFMVTLNERITPAGVNFDQKPIGLRVNEIRGKTKDEFDIFSPVKAKKLIELLNAANSIEMAYIWSQYLFPGDVRALAQSSEDLSLLINTVEVSRRRWIALEVINALYEHYDLLTSDQKKQADAMITRELRDLRFAQSPLAKNLKNAAESLQIRLRGEQGPYVEGLYIAERVTLNTMDDWQKVVIKDGGRVGFITLEALYGNEVFDFYNQKFTDLWLHDDLTIEQKTELYGQFQEGLVRNLQQLQEFQWIAQKLYAKAREDTDGNETGEHLTVAKVKELLIQTPIEDITTLGVYFGIAPEDVREIMEQEQREMVLNYAERNNMYGIMGTYPKDALPLITTLIEKGTVKGTSIIAAEAVLHMHYKELSQDEITNLRAAIDKTLYKHTSVEDQLTAFRVLKEIDEIFLPGGVDFTQPEPFTIALKKAVQTSDGLSPRIEQVKILAAMLKDKNAFYWDEFFNEHNLVILAIHPEETATLIDIGRAQSIHIATLAIETLIRHPESITDEVRDRVDELIAYIQNFRDRTGSSDDWKRFIDAGDALQSKLQERDEPQEGN